MARRPFPHPHSANEDEAYRLTVLRSLELLDSPPEAEFDALVRLAQHVMQSPMAVVTLIDANRQWFKARCGIDATETPREIAFCDHAIREPEMLVVPDASCDIRFARNPMVVGEPHVRFYAGIPLRVALEEGAPLAAIGTLCVIDTNPRILSVKEAEMLRNLARLAESQIRGRMHVRRAVRYGEDRRIDAARIGRQHRLLAQTERMAGIGSWRLTLADNSVTWSDQVFAIYGLPVGQIPPVEDALSFYPAYERPRIENALSQAIKTGLPIDMEADFAAADGTRKRVRTIGELELVDGRPVALIGVFQDITARHNVELALRLSATQDVLTGIANRAGFNNHLDDSIAANTAEGEQLALILIDLDGFKQVNDNFGHQAGDTLLKQVARRLRIPAMPSCVPARLGGDEFAMIVSGDHDCAQIQDIVDYVLIALRRPVEIDGGEVAVSATLGVAWMQPGVVRAELMHRADLALYEAKNAGKDTVHFWHPGTQIPAREPHGRRAGSRR